MSSLLWASQHQSHDWLDEEVATAGGVAITMS